MPNWATSGDGTRNPDLSAPGAHIDSLRAPLSRVDLEHPEGFVSDTLFRGSGSSQAAAVVSGAAALLLDARPSLTPDQVKALLIASAAADQDLAGARQVLRRRTDPGRRRRRPAHPDHACSRGRCSDGSAPLSAARLDGGINVLGQPIIGETTVLGTPWDGTRWTGTRWTGGTWDGTRWTGGEWMGTRWTDSSWTGTRWTGTPLDRRPAGPDGRTLDRHPLDRHAWTGTLDGHPLDRLVVDGHPLDRWRMVLTDRPHVTNGHDR